MIKYYFVIGWLFFVSLNVGLADANECMIEGDLVKVTARLWHQDNGQWMAQLEKPVCVLGILPESQTSYKVSDVVMLIKLYPTDNKMKKILNAINYKRGRIQGIIKTDHNNKARTKCSIIVSDIITDNSGVVLSEVLQRGEGKHPWVLLAKEALQGILSHNLKANNIAQDALKLIHPMSNYQDLADWSIEDKGKNLVLNMRISWKGKILQKLYYTDIEWHSNQQGHIIAEITKDSGKLPVTKGKVKEMDDYFRTQLWPALYSKLK